MKKSILAVTLASTLALAATGHTEGRNIVTVAGKNNDIGEGGPATAAALNTPRGVGVDAEGNVYIAEFGNNRIRKVDAVTHVMTTVTGNGVADATGDGGLASLASVNGPRDVSVDRWGNIWVSEFTGQRVRKIDKDTHVITTIAGNGTTGVSGDLGPATSAQLNTPRSVVVDGDGNVYIADSGNGRIRKVDAAQNISTIVGGGPSGAEDVLGTQAGTGAVGLALDGDDNLIFSTGGTRVRKYDRATGRVRTIAGQATAGYNGDGKATDTQLNGPGQPAFDNDGNIIVPEVNTNRIRKISPGTGGFDGLVALPPPATECPTTGPTTEKVTFFGSNYCRDPLETVTTLVGIAGASDDTDGCVLTNAKVSNPTVVVRDIPGNLYVAAGFTVRMISGGCISTYAGGGTFFTGDKGPAVAGQFNLPFGVHVDRAGNLYVAEVSGSRARIVTPDGKIDTVAGTGTSGFSGDGGNPTAARLNTSFAVTTDASGSLFIADGQNNRIRKVSGGKITTVAGNGASSPPPGSALAATNGGDGGKATDGIVSQPQAVTFDAHGNLFIAANGNARIRKISPGTGGFDGLVALPPPATECPTTGPTTEKVTFLGSNYCRDPDEKITTVSGLGLVPFPGDLGPAAIAGQRGPRGMAFDVDGNLYIANQGNAVRKIFAGTGDNDVVDGLVLPPCGGFTSQTQTIGTLTWCRDPEEIISTVVGTFAPGYNGEGVPATSALLNAPFGVAIDSVGNLYIVEMPGQRVRMVDLASPIPTITTVAGNGIAGLPHDGGPATSANLNAPRAIAVDLADNIYFSDGASNRIRRLNLAAEVEVSPGTLNALQSNGQWITAYVRVPGHEVTEINRDSVQLQAVDPTNGAVRVSGGAVLAVKAAKSSLVDSDGDGTPDQLALKFGRATVAGWAAGASQLVLRVEGQLQPPLPYPVGTYFSADTPVRSTP